MREKGAGYAQGTANMECEMQLPLTLCMSLHRDRAVHRQTEAISAFEEKSFFFFFPADLLIHLDWEAKEIFFLEQSEKEFIHAVHVTIYENTVE